MGVQSNLVEKTKGSGGRLYYEIKPKFGKGAGEKRALSQTCTLKPPSQRERSRTEALESSDS